MRLPPRRFAPCVDGPWSAKESTSQAWSVQRCIKSIAIESSAYPKMRISSMAKIEVPTIAGVGTKLSVGRWFKRVGDPVTVQEPLVEIDTDTDGVTHEIRAPVTGVLSRILVKDGGTVEPGTVLGMIDQV
jgi:biotin carboxyl carrier protein